MTKLVRFMKDESGATAIEYGLIAAALGVALVIAAPLLADSVSGVFERLSSALDESNPGL